MSRRPTMLVSNHSGGARDERAVRALAIEVVRRIQAMLDRLRDEG